MTYSKAIRLLPRTTDTDVGIRYMLLFRAVTWKDELTAKPLRSGPDKDEGPNA